MHPDTQLIISPEYIRLKAEMEAVRQELIALVLERNDLIYTRIPELERCYARMVGGLENDLADVRVQAVRLKYIIEMIRLRLKFDKVIDIEEIERRVDESCEKAVISKGDTNDVKDESQTGCKALTDRELEEMRLIYRKVIKTLHPDMSGDGAAASERLLKNAIEAYENRDLVLLKNIEEILTRIDSSGIDEDSAQNQLIFLKMRIKELKIKKKDIGESIKAVRAEFPLNQEKFLSDLRRVESRQKKLETAIEAENEKVEKLQNRLRYYKLKCN